MKRSREVSIIVDALTDAGLIQESNTDRARCIIKGAIKKIRREQYDERHRKDLSATEQKVGWLKMARQEKLQSLHISMENRRGVCKVNGKDISNSVNHLELTFDNGEWSLMISEDALYTTNDQKVTEWVYW